MPDQKWSEVYRSFILREFMLKGPPQPMLTQAAAQRLKKRRCKWAKAKSPERSKTENNSILPTHEGDKKRWFFVKREGGTIRKRDFSGMGPVSS